MTKYVYFLSILYLPAPVIASATKTNNNSSACDATTRVSPFDKWKINAINMVKASTKAVGRVNNPIIINSEPTHSVATAAKPQKEVAKVIPILCIAEPIFSQFDVPSINFGIP